MERQSLGQSKKEETMELGYFTMPSHPPERPLKDGHEWDLQVIRWLDELGYKECWIGEHHTAPWEPHPSPDLLVAQALMQTKHIRLGPGGFLLPYHHPAELANRVAMLDHISGGRLNFGVAASGPAERLEDVQRRRREGRQPRDDARGARHHPQALVHERAVRVRRQVLDRAQSRADVRLPQAAHQAAAEAASRRSASPGFRKVPTR